MVSKEMLKSLQELREKAYEEKKLAAGERKNRRNNPQNIRLHSRG